MGWDWGLGRQASWAVHGSVHVWGGCMGGGVVLLPGLNDRQDEFIYESITLHNHELI